MSFVIEDVLVRSDPVGTRLPVVFDSPHSGFHYPADFEFVCPLGLLRQAEDAYVDELFAVAPEYGGTLLAAQFPRTYVDLNRAIDDIDLRQFDGSWRGTLRPSEKSALGMGLIWTQCKPGVPVYDGKLPIAEVADRIDRYYRPYHAQLKAILDGSVARFGAVWHINCHSMPSTGGSVRTDSTLRPDFVIGDRDGTTSEPGFVDFLALTLRNYGYRVGLNVPYKGVELVRRYSNPSRGRHSIQLEINRSLYMDEDSLDRNQGFERLREVLQQVIIGVCSYVDRRLEREAAAE